MEEQQIALIPPNYGSRRFAYRIGDRLPKGVRVIYYILLILTLVYVTYRLGRAFLIGLQKAGCFCFNPQHYWIFMACVGITLLISILLAQFIWQQDPIGNFFNGIGNCIKNIRIALGNWIKGGA